MVKPTWEPAEGPVPCDTDPSRGRGEMDLRATRLMTGLRTGNQPVLKTKRPRRGCLIPPRAEKALPISAGACPRQDSAPAARAVRTGRQETRSLAPGLLIALRVSEQTPGGMWVLTR